LAVVRLLLDYPPYRKGTNGTVVHVYHGGEGYEVEFDDPPGVITVHRVDLELA